MKQFDKFVKKYGIPASILIGCLFIAVSIYFSFGGSSADPDEAARTDVSVDDDAFLGKDNAAVTIIEFSDYQCPFCRKFWLETLPLLKSAYIDTGKARLVYRDFPLPMHTEAQIAAEAAECAEDQGKYWQMHDKIFAEQAKQGQGTVSYSSDNLKAWAREIGLAPTAFVNCLDSSQYSEEVKADHAAGVAAAVTGTPTFFVNGIKIAGAQPFETFRAVIDKELKRAK